MSNQVGDRYSCSDPNCGCEIEIERPCTAFAGADSDRDDTQSDILVSSGSESSMSQKARDFRPDDAVSTPGDFGSQGATGEGLFGTTGSGRSATTSGRYDTESTRVREGHSNPAPRGTARNTFTCFCGNEMRLVASAQQRANAARPGV